MKKHHVLVTGADQPLGAAVSDRLLRRDDLTVVEVAAHVTGYDALAGIVRDREIDTVIHAGLVWWSASLDADVIATMRLAAAAAQPGSTVRTIAAASSTAAYPASVQAPRLRRESEEILPEPGSIAARVIEAERYLHTLAETRPDMCVAILRLADLSGSPPLGPLARLLHDRAMVPAMAGFNDAVQLLDIDDAAAALVHAVHMSLAGVYNVAGMGSVPWRTAIRLAHKRALPIVAPPAFIASPAQTLKFPVLASDTLDTLRYGRTVDTSLMAATGFEPASTTAECAASLATRSTA